MRVAVLFGFLLVAFPSSPVLGAWADDKPYTSTAKERTTAFRWFGTLGFPDLKDRKLIRLVNARRNRDTYGFLLSDKGENLSVFTALLQTETFAKGAVGYETVALGKLATDHLKALRDKDDGAFGLRIGFEENFSGSAGLFVLAWACWHSGLEGLASELFNQVAGAYGGAAKLQKGLADTVAHELMWRGIVDFGNPEIPRSRLLERFEHLARYFPGSEHHKRARATADLLKKMVREDAEHAARRKGGKPFDKLTRREQIADLIFRLRDQTGQQWSQPGSCDIFQQWPPNEDSPAHLLVKMGYEAIPQLLEVLGDERFTRAVTYGRSFYFSHTVLTVDHCAERIIERIAGRSFYGRGETRDQTRAAVKAWYEQLLAKGEKTLLQVATAKGDGNSAEQARRLLEKYPNAALPALLAGARAARDPWTRYSLVFTVGDVKGEAPVAFLLTEVKDGPLLRGRLAAAQCLHNRGRSEGVKAMIAEWQRPRRLAKAEQDDPFWHGSSDVADFLASCGKAEAVAALGKDWGKRSVNVRLHVVWALENCPLQPGDGKLHDDPATLRAAVERVLIAALDDTDRRMGMSGSWNGKSFSDPRICDIAGNVLNMLDAERHPFDLSAPRSQRERARLLLKNGWRVENGLPVVPLPVSRRIVLAPDATLQPLLDELLKAPEAKRPGVQQRIEQLGPGALPGVRARRKTVREDEPGATLLDELARRLASTVAEVVVAKDSLKPDAKLAARLKRLEGKPLTARGFLDLAGSLVKDLPKGVRAMRWVLERDDDGTGVTVRLDLLDAARADPSQKSRAGTGKPNRWNFSERVAVGDAAVHGTTGQALLWAGDYLERSLNEAVTSAPEQPFGVYVELIPQW